MSEKWSRWSDLERPSLREHQLRRALVVEDGFFASLSVVDETASTNADLAERARGGAAEGAVLVAEFQREGRGRLDRSWVAPPRSSLTFSVLFRPSFPVARWSWLPLMASVAVAQPLARHSGLDVRVKWPNDVLVADQKVAGVLAERVDDAVVIGVGLNVSQRQEELPTTSATSLVLAGSTIIDRDPLLRSVLRSFASLYTDLQEAAGDPEAAGLRSVYAGLCSTLKRAVRVELPDGEVLEGVAVDVDGDGRLVVRRGPGTLEPVASGDVVHVR